MERVDLLITEFRSADSGDKWGDAVEWMFAVCDVLHWHTPAPVPQEWEYKPSAFGPGDGEDESYAYSVLLSFYESGEVDVNDITTFGRLLHILIKGLEAEGKDC